MWHRPLLHVSYLPIQVLKIQVLKTSFKVNGIPSSFMFPYENHPILFDPKRGNLFNETIQKNDQIVYCAERAVSGWACTLGGQRQIFPKKDLVPFALADLID